MKRKKSKFERASEILLLRKGYHWITKATMWYELKNDYRRTGWQVKTVGGVGYAFFSYVDTRGKNTISGFATFYPDGSFTEEFGFSDESKLLAKIDSLFQTADTEEGDEYDDESDTYAGTL